jgi:uncharacterized membrane protein
MTLAHTLAGIVLCLIGLAVVVPLLFRAVR